MEMAGTRPLPEAPAPWLLFSVCLWSIAVSRITGRTLEGLRVWEGCRGAYHVDTDMSNEKGMDVE